VSSGNCSFCRILRRKMIVLDFLVTLTKYLRKQLKGVKI
jgi:hypothetical protein